MKVRLKNAVPSLLLAALGLSGAAHAAGLPAITPADTFQGGQTLSFQNLPVSETVTADLVFVNLAATANRCAVALTSTEGARMGPVVTLTLTPLESRPFVHVFERLAEIHGSGLAEAQVSCSHDFSVQASLTDVATGQVDRIEPRPEDSVLLALPAEAKACSADAVCFDAEGLVHVPEVANAVGRLSFPAPAGVAKRLRVSMDVKVGDWFPQEPNGKHLIYWFVIDRNFYMPGLLYFRGPGKNQAFARHGMGLTHPKKIKIIKPFKAKSGQTYRVDNDYDMARGTYKVTVTDAETGKVEVVLTGRPNVKSYTISTRSKFIVDMGFPLDVVDTEVPSYGWEYSNVHVEAFLQ
jgi:hypothetical protein